MYDYFKALHIIFVVTWFAGLFYLPRLFIYYVEAQERTSIEVREALKAQFLIMQRRLWYGITWPSCILAILFGSSMLSNWLPLSDNPWLVTKLVFVLFLFLYHLSLGYIYKKQRSGLHSFSSTQLRVWNEVSSVFLIAIVFLVVLKNLLGMFQAIIGLFVVMITLMSAIMIYRKIRLKAR
jgi:putative membrane protein